MCRCAGMQMCGFLELALIAGARVRQHWGIDV